MRVLCDVHVPYRLVKHFQALGVDATHVNRILEGSITSDAAIAAFADAHDLWVISKDRDFRDRHFLRGSPARLLRLVLGNVSNDELIALVKTHWSAIVAGDAAGHRYIELSRAGLLFFPVHDETS